MLSAFLAAVRIVLCWLDVTHRRKTALASGICDSVGDTVLSKPMQNQCPCSVSGDSIPFAGPVDQMRCKTKVPDTCSRDRFHSKLEQKVGDCPGTKLDLLTNECTGKGRMTGGHGSLSPVCVIHGSSALRDSGRVLQPLAWQRPPSRCSRALCRWTGSTVHPRRELASFHRWKRMNSISGAWTAVAIFMEPRMKAFCS